MAHTVVWLITLMLAGMATAGCAMMLDGESIPCLDSLDCPAGTICDSDTHYCVPSDTPDSLIDLELIPGAEASGAPTQIAAVDLDDPRINPEALELELLPGLSLVGHVGSPMGVPGSLVAKRTAEFGNRSLSWNITVDSAGYFEAFLSQGAFDLLFRPTNREDFPQLQVTGLEFGNSVGEHNLDLAYPGYPAAEDIETQEEHKILLVQVQVLQSEASPHPVSGIQVEAITDAGLRSNLVTPDAQGMALLRLPVIIRSDLDHKIMYPNQLSLSLGPAATGAHLPQVKTEAMDIAGVDMGVVYVGDLPASHGVSGAVTDNQGSAVPSCQLRFETALGNGTFSHTIESDAQGAFSTTLPEGDYLVTAIPGIQRLEGMGTSELSVAGVTSGVAVMLDPRFEISGVVYDPARQPLPDVSVIAERVADWTGADDGIQRSYETISDTEGHFELPVDSGSYQFSLLPPTASGLPRKPAESLFVYDDVELDAAKTSLSDAASLQGHVFSNTGVPQCGVSIKVFRDVDGQAVLVGQGVSESAGEEGCTGAYAIVIPAQ